MGVMRGITFELDAHVLEGNLGLDPKRDASLGRVEARVDEVRAYLQGGVEEAVGKASASGPCYGSVRLRISVIGSTLCFFFARCCVDDASASWNGNSIGDVIKSRLQ